MSGYVQETELFLLTTVSWSRLRLKAFCSYLLPSHSYQTVTSVATQARKTQTVHQVQLPASFMGILEKKEAGLFF